MTIRPHHTRLAAVLGLGLLASTALSGCGSSASSSPTTPASAGTSSTSTANGQPVNVNGVEVKQDATAAALLPAQFKSGIRIVTSAPYPPFESFDANQNLQGLDIDTGNAIAAVLGTTANWTSIDYNGVIPALQAGKYDMVLASIGDTPEREKVLDFVDYSKQGQVLVVPTGNPNQITGLKDMCGRVMSVESGNINAGYFDSLDTYCTGQGKAKMTIKELPKTSDALLAMKAGQAAAVYIGVATAADLKSKPEGAGYDVITPTDKPFGYLPRWVGAGIPKNNAALRDAVAAALKVLIADGTLNKLYAKYGQERILTGQVDINKIVAEPLV
jgi:polar amino acid transport system substrate-binding protein